MSHGEDIIQFAATRKIRMSFSFSTLMGTSVGGLRVQAYYIQIYTQHDINSTSQRR